MLNDTSAEDLLSDALYQKPVKKPSKKELEELDYESETVDKPKLGPRL